MMVPSRFFIARIAHKAASPSSFSSSRASTTCMQRYLFSTRAVPAVNESYNEIMKALLEEQLQPQQQAMKWTPQGFALAEDALPRPILQSPVIFKFELSYASHLDAAHKLTALMEQNALTVCRDDELEVIEETAPFGGTSLFTIKGNAIAATFKPIIDLDNVQSDLLELAEEMNCEFSMEEIDRNPSETCNSKAPLQL